LRRASKNQRRKICSGAAPKPELPTGRSVTTGGHYQDQTCPKIGFACHDTFPSVCDQRNRLAEAKYYIIRDDKPGALNSEPRSRRFGGQRGRRFKGQRGRRFRGQQGRCFRGANSLSPHPEMRPRDGGLVMHEVWAMRDDDARTSRDAAARRRTPRARGLGEES
jgi:hypothetical protein